VTPGTGTRPRFEVADILQTHAEDYRRLHQPSPAQQKVMRHIADCRTAALGGHLEECDSCGHWRISFNSCRDRHCPKCQSTAREDWIEAQLSKLLPVPYFHVVFTLPEQLNPLALANQKILFDILFATAASTLREIAADPQHLGADIGFTAVLHTWGQNLLFHPHLHCVVTGGGLSADGEHWVGTRASFFLPVKALSKLFRGKFLDALKKAYLAGQLRLHGSTAELAEQKPWRSFLNGLYKKNWVVYAKPPFAGPEHVFRYLGRYTHRVAISNHRLVDFHDGRVSFTIKNYAQPGQRMVIHLDALEFLRRFLLHVLPKGYTRIRHFGLCAGRNLHTKLEAARRLLTTLHHRYVLPISRSADKDNRPWWKRFLDRTGIDLLACTHCTSGRLIRRGQIEPVYPVPPPGVAAAFVNSS
jgi:hypothetical protein